MTERPTPLDPTVAAEIEFHTAGYFHPNAVVCSAKEAERIARELSEAREKLEDALRSCNSLGARLAEEIIAKCDQRDRAKTAEQKLERRDALLREATYLLSDPDFSDDSKRLLERIQKELG